MKYCGKVGYVYTEETSPGIWEEKSDERTYYGDVIRNTMRYQQANQQINDNVEVSEQISIIADSFAYQNFHRIRYAEFMGINWKVTTVDVQRPRLILTLGGEYIGEQA